MSTRGIFGAGQPRRLARMARLGIAAVLATIALAACSAARNSLGTTNGACFVTLPAADTAIGGHGNLVGVRLVSLSTLRKVSPALYRSATDRPGARVATVCLVAFRGRFTSVGVRHPIGALRGRLAVVEVAYPSKEVLATLLIARTPLPFGHSHIGFL